MKTTNTWTEKKDDGKNRTHAVKVREGIKKNWRWIWYWSWKGVESCAIEGVKERDGCNGTNGSWLAMREDKNLNKERTAIGSESWRRVWTKQARGDGVYGMVWRWWWWWWWWRSVTMKSMLFFFRVFIWAFAVRYALGERVQMESIRWKNSWKHSKYDENDIIDSCQAFCEIVKKKTQQQKDFQWKIFGSVIFVDGSWFWQLITWFDFIVLRSAHLNFEKIALR